MDIDDLSGAASAFIWIKKDPLRTADEIADGPAYFHIAGELGGDEIPQEWRGIYNDDTDICLRMLKDGWCTINFNAFSGDKDATMVTKGGNTPIYTKGDLRSDFADSLVEQHPDCVQKVWRYDRWHHHVDYSSFKKNILIKKDGIDIPNEINDFGMELINAREF